MQQIKKMKFVLNTKIKHYSQISYQIGTFFNCQICYLSS